MHSRLQCKNRYPIYDQNGGKIAKKRYPIYDQNSWKTLPFGAAHTYIAHVREYPPGLKTHLLSEMNSLFLCESSFCSHKLKKFTPLHQFHNHQNPGTGKTGLEIPSQLKHLTHYYPFSMYPVFVFEDLMLVALPQPTLHTIVNWWQAGIFVRSNKKDLTLKKCPRVRREGYNFL